MYVCTYACMYACEIIIKSVVEDMSLANSVRWYDNSLLGYDAVQFGTWVPML
jgi:hypothetical protein